jgi:hypothetical protein
MKLFYFGQNRKRNMKKTFQKSLLAAAVLASSASFAAEIGTTNLLFPFVSSGSSAFTFLTISNGNGTVGNAGGAMHYIYGMKASTATNAAGCEHSDGNGTLTANDVTQFEMSNKVNVATSLANGDTNGGFAWTGGADKSGFLIVNSNGLSGDGLYGSAVVVDTASGLKMAYSTQGLNTTNALPADFSIDNTAAVGGPEAASQLAIGAANGNHMLTWYATPGVTSSWYVVPLGLETLMSPSAAIGGIAASYSMYNTAGTLGGAYDMKEAFTSGSLPAPVVCTGSLTRALLLQSGALANSNLGGMGVLATTITAAASGGTTNKSLVYSVQSTSLLAGGTSNFINRVTHR